MRSSIQVQRPETLKFKLWKSNSGDWGCFVNIYWGYLYEFGNSGWLSQIAARVIKN